MSFYNATQGDENPAPAVDGPEPTPPTDYAAMEQMMAEKMQQESPTEVQEFIDELQQDGINAEEIDEIRQLVLAAFEGPEQYAALIEFMASEDMIDPEDAPAEPETGFVLAVLGMVGAAQASLG